eukprot:Hpha_TRINITY_DN7084_c0_g1::TRINITY_DN7084_c0_g1_i1::g.22922::m.22922
MKVVLMVLALVAGTYGEGPPCVLLSTSESVCNADSRCVWCNCSASPSSCWSCADAQGLVPSNYHCDKGVVPGSSNGTCGSAPEKKEVKKAVPAVKPQPAADCSDSTTESACNADSGCVWCNCSALPSSCWSCADAQKLVPSINHCDKGVVPGSSNGTCGTA